MKLLRLAVTLMSIITFGGCMSNSQSSGAAGVSDGLLAPCPSSPNCVSTMVTSSTHAIDPIQYQGSREGAIAVILELLAAPNREKITVMTSTDEYVHAVFITPIMRFKDDVEFYLPEGEGIIHFRSASRIGQSDLGKNRERMETFRKAFQAAMNK